ncbi:Ppx/GppA phosphatase family protein [Paenibacillus chitinolyticus]
MNRSRYAIIDIGSNSVRLVIYEVTPPGAYRILHETKETARLSERIGEDGAMTHDGILSVVPLLRRFKRICGAYSVDSVKAAATAAIRNAANAEDIARELAERSGIVIDILSGEEEARLGFQGVVSTLDVRDGFIVDIGGGSTEITLFLDRKRVNSVSFPFGAVTAAREYTPGGIVRPERIEALKALVQDTIDLHPWIREHAQLPLISLGGAGRALAKLNQKRVDYPLPVMHNYELEENDLRSYMDLLPSLPVEKRKKLDGLSKGRADIIVAGVVLLHSVYRQTSASRIIVSSAGLRDGLFYETAMPERLPITDVLQFSVENMLKLHTPLPHDHLRRAAAHAAALYDVLADSAPELQPRHRSLLHAAALLQRIGYTVSSYQHWRHTFHLITESRIDGLTHREIVLCALIATFKNKNRTRQQALPYASVLDRSDEDIAARLGSLLRLASSLDYGENGNVAELDVRSVPGELHLHLLCKEQDPSEIGTIEETAEETGKYWSFTAYIHASALSTD